MTALKEYTRSSAADKSDKSVLISTVVQVLSYLSVQHDQEIKDNLLALFIVSQSVDHSKGQKLKCFIIQSLQLGIIPGITNL